MESLEYWTERASKFGAQGASYLDPIYHYWDEKLRRMAVARLNLFGPSKRVIDLGCGGGVWSRYLGKKGCKVFAIDFVDVLIQEAKRNSSGLDIVYAVGDIRHDLPEEWEQCDAVLTVTVLQHILSDSELAETLGEIHGALKPGGVLVAIESISNTRTPDYGYFKKRRLNELDKLASQHNLARIKVKRVNFITPMIYSFWRHSLRRARELKNHTKNVRSHVHIETGRDGSRPLPESLQSEYVTANKILRLVQHGLLAIGFLFDAALQVVPATARHSGLTLLVYHKQQDLK